MGMQADNSIKTDDIIVEAKPKIDAVAAMMTWACGAATSQGEARQRAQALLLDMIERVVGAGDEKIIQTARVALETLGEDKAAAEVTRVVNVAARMLRYIGAQEEGEQPVYLTLLFLVPILVGARTGQSQGSVGSTAQPGGIPCDLRATPHGAQQLESLIAAMRTFGMIDGETKATLSPYLYRREELPRDLRQWRELLIKMVQQAPPPPGARDMTGSQDGGEYEMRYMLVAAHSREGDPTPGCLVLGTDAEATAKIEQWSRRCAAVIEAVTGGRSIRVFGILVPDGLNEAHTKAVDVDRLEGLVAKAAAQDRPLSELSASIVGCDGERGPFMRLGIEGEHGPIGEMDWMWVTDLRKDTAGLKRHLESIGMGTVDIAPMVYWDEPRCGRCQEPLYPSRQHGLRHAGNDGSAQSECGEWG